MKFRRSGLPAWLALVALSLLLLAFILRTPAVSWYLHRKAAQYSLTHGVRLEVDRVRFHGLASVLVTGIRLVPANGDTLLAIDSAYASVGILKLFAGRLALHDVRLVNTWLQISRHDSMTNFDFLLRGKKPAEDTLRERVTDYAATTGRLARLVFDKIPLAFDLRNFNFALRDNGHALDYHLDRLKIEKSFFRTVAVIAEAGDTTRWIVAGRVDNGNRTAEFRVMPDGGLPAELPLFRHYWGAGLAFDTLAFSIVEADRNDTTAGITGFASLRGLQADHFRVAAQPVTFDRLEIRYQLNIGRDYAEVDSATLVTFNRVDFHPYLKVRPKPSLQFTLSIRKPPFPAQDLFSSFPEGLFTNLDGMKVRGELSLYLDFFVDLAIPDSLRFSTSLDRHQFGVISYGNADLGRINGPFEYTAYDRDIPVRTFTIGPGNPSFRPLSRISPYLQAAVLTSEDGGFYLHRGFLADAFRESIITNIKERRFARGGSTISMQLVKNVFLSRNKTVARKMEEALLVWLLENQGISTKERMFEVYLNIIEWGPLVYGAGEAAHYYFAKEPSKLTLAEAIFMASVIPRPKWFRYSFDADGHLREHMSAYYGLVSRKMAAKGWITQQEADALVPDVELKGPARLLLKQADSLPPDTLAP